MSSHWYVIANQEEAKIFTGNRLHKEVQFLKRFSNPDAHVKTSDLVKKKASRNILSFGARGSVRYSEQKRTDPHDEMVHHFARDLVAFLVKAHQQHEFETLTIAAEARFLGKIKSLIPQSLEKVVVDWIHKDLQKKNDQELSDILF